MFTYLISQLKRIFSRRREDPFSIYQLRERLIYRYYDGMKTRAADPLILYRKVMDCGPELSIDIKVARSPMKDAGKAHDKMIAKIRAIFDIKPLEEGGLTEVETANLLDHFLTYCGIIKKNSSPSVMLSNNSEVSPTSSDNNDQTTTPSSDSGSIANESPTDVPKSSPSEPESL